MTAHVHRTADLAIAEAIGNRLRAAREDRGLTQTEFAAEAGLSQSQLSDYERGVSIMSSSCLVRLARLLGVPLAGLAGD